MKATNVKMVLDLINAGKHKVSVKSHNESKAHIKSSRIRLTQISHNRVKSKRKDAIKSPRNRLAGQVSNIATSREEGEGETTQY